MNEAKRLTNLARQRCIANADRAVRECENVKCDEGFWKLDSGEHWYACPDCTPIAKAWRDKAEGFCWHKWEQEYSSARSPKHYYVNQGGVESDRPINPTYTNPVDIRKVLEVLEEVDGFLDWHTRQIREFANDGHCKCMLVIDINEIASFAYVEIIWNEALLLQAAISYLEVE